MAELKKGDEVWRAEISSYAKLYDTPRVGHGVVVGGGPVRLIVQWDHWPRPQGYARGAFERDACKSERDAWLAAKYQLTVILTDAEKRARVARDALFTVKLQLGEVTVDA